MEGRAIRTFSVVLIGLMLVPMAALPTPVQRSALDTRAIEQASGEKTTVTDDGVVRIGWSRDDVEVSVEGRRLPPAAGLC